MPTCRDSRSASPCCKKHMSPTKLEKLRRRWRGQVFGTTYSAHARGTLIWVRAGIPFVHEESLVDEEGRYTFIRGRLNGQIILLGSLYAPNVDQPSFLVRLSRELIPWTGIPWVLGGDFNSVLNADLDRSFPHLIEPQPHPMPRLSWTGSQIGRS